MNATQVTATEEVSNKRIGNLLDKSITAIVYSIEEILTQEPCADLVGLATEPLYCTLLLRAWHVGIRGLTISLTTFAKNNPSNMGNNVPHMAHILTYNLVIYLLEVAIVLSLLIEPFVNILGNNLEIGDGHITRRKMIIGEIFGLSGGIYSVGELLSTKEKHWIFGILFEHFSKLLFLSFGISSESLREN